MVFPSRPALSRHSSIAYTVTFIFRLQNVAGSFLKHFLTLLNILIQTQLFHGDTIRCAIQPTSTFLPRQVYSTCICSRALCAINCEELSCLPVNIFHLPTSQQKLPAVQTLCWYLRVQWVKVLDDYVELAKVSYHLALKGFVSIHHIRSFQQNTRPTRCIIVIDFGSQFMSKKCKNKCVHSGMTLAFSSPLASSSKQPGRNKHWYLHVHNEKNKTKQESL